SDNWTTFRVRQCRRGGFGKGNRRCPSRLAPYLLGDLDDQLQLAPLVLLGEDVALDGRGEAALAREAELLERRVARRLLDAALEVVLRLELAALRRHQAEHDLLVALRQQP